MVAGPFFVGGIAMPTKPKVPCRHPGCPKLVPAGSKFCEEHTPLHSEDRPGAAGRGYDHRWRKARERYLKTHPLCVRCLEEKRMTKATVVDHIIPHRGDLGLFWDEGNWQSLCKHHHDQKTMTEDRYQEYHY